MGEKNKRKLRILTIDDEDSTRQMLEMIYGYVYRLDDAENLADGRAKLMRNQYDVVILDMNLPDGHGTDLLRAIRQDPDLLACRDVPVVMLTASSDGDLCEQSWDLGSIAYVKKPFEIPDLSTAIDMAAAMRE